MTTHCPSWIVHLDVDAFFASVEQLLIPALRRRPVIVGSGVIASCSYEARKFGLRAGMPLRRAMELCPSAVRLAGQYPIYRCFAEHVWEICRRYVTSLDTYLDEAYGDATSMDAHFGQPLALGRRLQQAVADEVRLPVSVGLAGNRMMAKVASSHGKPGGVVWIPPHRAETFLADLPVRKLPGVGHKTAEILDDLNIRTIGELRRLSRAALRAMFGLRGEVLHERCRGRDSETLRPRARPRTISRETTFHKPEPNCAKVQGMLHYLLERAARTMRQQSLMTKTVELAIHYDDGKRSASAKSLAEPADDDDVLLETALALLARLHTRRVSLRHVGIVLSNFVPASEAMTLFEHESRTRAHDIYRVLDSIRDRWGHAAIVTGKSIELLGTLKQNDYGFILRTPSLTK